MLTVNTLGIIDPVREMHYAFHHSVNKAMFPQVHDFYEISLITDGVMDLEINRVSERLSSGSLTLIRPGDIHDRREVCGNCAYINLAFPARIITEMFQYLDMPQMSEAIMSPLFPPHVNLYSTEFIQLQTQLKRLNFYPPDQPHVVCRELRRLILNIMLQFFVPAISEPANIRWPRWLNELVRLLEDPDMLSTTLEELAEQAHCSKEHLCRSFRKYLGVSPLSYLNTKRLNYAANLLRNSDLKVIDIAYASGFQSLSRFYHAFKQEFHMSALEYRRSCPPILRAINRFDSEA